MKIEHYYIKPSKGSTSLLVIFSAVLFFVLVAVPFLIAKPIQSSKKSQSQSAKTFTLNALKKFDGTDPTLPIYMGLDGKVYDVSSGRKYYEAGGPYHDLAGRDSSVSLREVKVDGLIKSKYPVVGILVW